MVMQMAVVLCTPSNQAPPAWTSAPSGNQGGYYAGTPSENYRPSLEMVKQVGAMLSWVTIRYVYECMDKCDSLVYPNGGFDSTHPSDGGQSVIERFAKIGKG